MVATFPTRRLAGSTGTTSSRRRWPQPLLFGEIVGRAEAVEIAADEPQFVAGLNDDSPVRVGERVEQRGDIVQVAGAAERPNRQQAHFGFAAAHELLQSACAFFIDLVDDQLARIAGQVIQQGVVAVVDHREELINLRVDLFDDQLAVTHLRAREIVGQAAAGEQHPLAELGVNTLLRGAEQKQDREGRVALRPAIARPTAICRLLGG